jgi:multidrug efflux pump subunit AcrB
MTLSIAIVISAVVSLTLTPTMCAQFLTAHSIADPNAPPAPKGWFGRIFGLWDRWFDRVALGYERSLAKALDRRFLMLGLTLGTIVLTVVLYIYVPKGLLPNQDTGALRGQTQAAPDISYQEMRRRQLAVMAVLATDPAIQDITSNIGSSGFNAPNDGRLNINLKPLDQRGISAQAVIDRLRPKLEKVPGIQTFLSTVQDAGFGARSSRARYQFTLTGPDLGQLTIFVDSIMKRMRLMNGIADVNTDREGNGQAINLVIDRDAAARYGVSVTTIDQTLYDAFGQRQVATTYEELNQYKVVLEVDPRLQGDPQALTHIFVAGSGGSQVPLSAVAKLVRGATPTAVAHQGIQPAITISFNTKDGVSIGTAMADIQATMASIVLPDGVAARFAGDALQASQSNASQPLLIGAALLAVYIVLGVLYESLVHPLTILSTIPSAGLGACLALLITDTELTIIALIGIIMLIGIVKKNAILMVDFALDAERMRGATPKEAIVEAARLRFRPIMMTTFAAVLGALPIALGVGAGSELRQPLGITVVGGLLVSQILTLYTTPVIYLAADRLRGRRSARLRQAIAGE